MGNLSADSMLDNIVAAGTLYTLTFMEEVSARLGWAWEPREVTPGRRPVMEIAGIDQALIGWQSTRRQQIADAMPLLVADYEARHGHAPGERATYALDRQAADRTRPIKPKAARSLSQLRVAWRESAVAAFGADVVSRLAERARAAAAAVWARVRPVVDVALAAVDVVAVVYVMHGAFAYRHLLAEARRHLTHTLRGQPHQPGLDEAIVQTAIGGYTRPVGRGRMMTADLRALYPRESGDQAVLRPLTRARSRPRYDRARLASAALTARLQAERRSRRLNSRSLPPTVTPAGPPPRPGLDRSPAPRRRDRTHPPEESHDHTARGPQDRGRRRPHPAGRPGARRRIRAAEGAADAEDRQGEEGGTAQAAGALPGGGTAALRRRSRPRRSRPRRGRIGSAASRRNARALSRMRHSTAWTR